MGVIERAKAVRLAAIDRLHPQRVVFHHVPKCGGTSVGRALRKRYLLSQSTVSPESSFRAHAAFAGEGDRERLLIDVLDLREQMLLYLLFEDVRCISAHIRFSQTAHARFAHAYKFVTILREPVSRFLSHYHWSHLRREDHGCIEEPFEVFLETERARRLGAMYVQYFAGLHRDADIRSPEAIEAAARNLERFDVVGRLDDLPAFEADIRAAVGIRLHIGHENRSTRSDSSVPDRLDPALRAAVETVCAPDLAVWRRVIAQREQARDLAVS